MKKTLVLILFFIINNTFSYELKSSFLKLNGHLIHYYYKGESGSPIILLTTYGVTADFWNKNFVNCLANSHQIYLLDYWGINTKSNTIENYYDNIDGMSLDVLAFIKQKKIHHGAIIGWAMGGAVALEVSFHVQRSQIKNLILISPIVPGLNNTLIPFPKNLLLSKDDILDYTLSNNLYDYNKNSLDKWENKFLTTKDIYPSPELSLKQKIAIAKWRNDPNKKFLFKHDKITALFVIGKNDTIIPQEQLLTIAKTYPQRRIYLATDSGNDVSMQKPAQVCFNVINYLR